VVETKVYIICFITLPVPLWYTLKCTCEPNKTAQLLWLNESQ